ncbi:3-hydroxyacyl-ACP dehydratase FabZ family protein [Desulfomarina sp.]
MQHSVTDLIPHRPPFLWVDTILSLDGDTIVTEKHIAEDLDIFTGHYPGNPLMPGVLLCEIIFQSGALLMAEKGLINENGIRKVPVLTRIENARFKRTVNPGDSVTVQVTLKEILAGVCFLKGKLSVGRKTAVTVNFSCALAAPAE